MSVFLSLFRLPPDSPYLSSGGGYESSVVAGTCLQEVVGFFSIASSVLSPGGEGFHSLASPALVELSGGLVFGSEIDEALRREVRKLKKSGFGGGSPVSTPAKRGFQWRCYGGVSVR
ncbi:hypothetical protein DY000_02031835 [Brassica cretica]|uniref:Uncharacterized protein n=1 Tax=Brassica cretica TaxID=69181 RepID=A0ABQ7DMM5_BRACR|nr:hypothetical protein DY000_02031835 [Brassica cretica]